VQDVPRLSGLLAAALGDWVDQTSLIPSTSGDPGTLGSWEGGGPRGEEREGRDSRAAGSQSGLGAAEYSLSVQQRLRLSRPVLKLRGLQDRRRRSA
jgi:hypothetical protein